MERVVAAQEANSELPKHFLCFFLPFSLCYLLHLLLVHLMQSRGWEEFIDSDSSIARRRLLQSSFALKLPVISFLCVNMCFLSGAWRRGGKKQARRQLWQAITPPLVWEAGRDELWSAAGARDWMLRRRRRKWPRGRDNTAETTIGATQGLTLSSNWLGVELRDGRKWLDTKQANKTATRCRGCLWSCCKTVCLVSSLAYFWGMKNKL